MALHRASSTLHRLCHFAAGLQSPQAASCCSNLCFEQAGLAGATFASTSAAIQPIATVSNSEPGQFGSLLRRSTAAAALQGTQIRPPCQCAPATQLFATKLPPRHRCQAGGPFPNALHRAYATSSDPPSAATPSRDAEATASASPSRPTARSNLSANDSHSCRIKVTIKGFESRYVQQASTTLQDLLLLNVSPIRSPEGGAALPAALQPDQLYFPLGDAGIPQRISRFTVLRCAPVGSSCLFLALPPRSSLRSF